MYKWIGSVLVFAGCGGFGFSLALAHRKRERMLEKLCRMLTVMECELRYRLTPLPELCILAAQETEGVIKEILLRFSCELDRRISPDAASCMRQVLETIELSNRDIRNILMELGRSLGRFDLEGQLKGIDHVRKKCELLLNTTRQQQTERIRCYETLGLCAGAALVILLV